MSVGGAIVPQCGSDRCGGACIQPLQEKGNVSALSHILDSIHIVDGDNFIHGIVSVNINDLVDHIVSNSNYYPRHRRRQDRQPV